MPMPILLHWDALAGPSLTPSVRKAVINGTGASLVRVSIARGTSADRHAHEFEQFVQVISVSVREKLDSSESLVIRGG